LQLLPEVLQIVYVFTDHCMLYYFSEVHKQKLAEYLLLYSVLERVQSQLLTAICCDTFCDNIATLKIVIIAVVIKLLQFCDNIELMTNPRVSLAKPFIYYSHTVYAFLCTGCELYINW